jgi:excisionase family DNA binding protein
MSKIKNDAVLTTEEAMQYLKISKPTLLKCVHLGKINATKVGREWRFLQSELYQFLKGTKGKVAG